MWTRALANALLPNCVSFIFSFHLILVSFICKKVDYSLEDPFFSCQH